MRTASPFFSPSPSGPLSRILFLLLLACLVAQPGCSRVKDKLERLASAAGKVDAPPAPDAVPLTEEERKLNDVLKSPDLFDASAAEPVVADIPEINKSAVVSILGYHDFRDRGGDAMVINVEKFREQMQSIKDSGIPVIRLQQLMDWKNGLHSIPPESFVITMDDGWEGVHRHAFPVLKEFGFPFTVYLYKKYVNIGGRSMTWAQIREMMDSGLCDVGSHSVSHDNLTSRKGRSEEAYQLYLLGELKDSKEFLEQNLKLPCTSFAYPYGNYNAAIRDLAHQVGYESMVTVNGSKVTWDTAPGELGRFIIHGVNDSVFRLATSFRGRGSVDSSKFVLADAKSEEGRPLVVLRPALDEVITERRPLIEADLSGLGPIVPASVQMHVAGLGTVPAVFDPATAVVSYRVPHRLRRNLCEVTLTFNRQGVSQSETLIWRFEIDLTASYMPRADTIPLQPVEEAPPRR